MTGLDQMIVTYPSRMGSNCPRIDRPPRSICIKRPDVSSNSQSALLDHPLLPSKRFPDTTLYSQSLIIFAASAYIIIMRASIISASVLALFTTGVNAACSYKSLGLTEWELKVYTGASCTGQTLRYGSTQFTCDCFNIPSPLNDKVNSFVYSGKQYINFYKDANCGGALLGESSDSTLLIFKLILIAE
jgi:hypothetical protein